MSRAHCGKFVLVACAFAVALIAGCAGEPVAPAKHTAVAVWDLDDLSPVAHPRADLGEMLAAKVIETLKAKGHVVVERQRLLLALEELKLGSSELADESARLRLGRIAGAGLMVFGAYQVAGETMRLDMRVVEVETGKVLRAVKKSVSSGEMQAWLDAARQAAEDLL